MKIRGCGTEHEGFCPYEMQSEPENKMHYRMTVEVAEEGTEWSMVGQIIVDEKHVNGLLEGLLNKALQKLGNVFGVIMP